MIELYNGDCIKLMHCLINDGVKVDAIIADIPYGIHNNKFDVVIPFEDMWECITKLIKPKVYSHINLHFLMKNYLDMNLYGKNQNVVHH